MKRAFFLVCMVLTALIARGQGVENQLIMSPENSGGTYGMQTSSTGNYGMSIIDYEDENGFYYDFQAFDIYAVIDSGECEGEKAMSFYFESFDIDPSDTLIIYNGIYSGPGTAAELFRCNNNLNPQIQTTVFATPLNATKALSLRFITNGDGNNGQGFKISVLCRDKCETIKPIIDSMYYKTRNGVIVDSAYKRWMAMYDTNFHKKVDLYGDTQTYWTLDTQWFIGVHLCVGEQLMLMGHGEYTNYYGYGPDDESSMFTWNFGNGDDTIGWNLNEVQASYRDLDCYDVTLSITDSRNCKSTTLETVKVRLSPNPIKTIYYLNPMCVTDELPVNIGYQGDNSTIQLEHIRFEQKKSRTIECKTFIPDGANVICPQADDEKCFRAPIFFDDFPAGRTVQSAADICSICINMEHSFLGDFGGHIICPTNQMAVLWYGNVGHDHILDLVRPEDRIEGTYNASGQKLGIPFGAPNHYSYDGKCGTQTADSYCDSICNMYGIGFEYCFSKNKDYTLTHGDPCNKEFPDKSDYFCITGIGSDESDTLVSHVWETVPAPYGIAGTTPTPAMNYKTRKPSDHENRKNYYLPATDLSNLIGCPMNGEWSIQLCDEYGSDNGWIFSWTLDFCGVTSGQGCEYQVGVDSVIWTPDSAYGDFDLGHWRGLQIETVTPQRSIIRSPDTAGFFPINVKIYDEFGCVWDTNTAITTVWAPTPNLGDTLLVCDIDYVVLDAKDNHTAITNQTFTWEPFGQTTDTIHTTTMLGNSTLYTVEVENNQEGITCRTRDSVRVNINRQPLPNFDPGIYPMEGCEPYTIHFENTSLFGDKYVWVFGDGDTSYAESPSHTYGTGQYDFKYFIETEYGCKDSLVYTDLITVYSSPVARFSWEPMNPTVMHPSVSFLNLTVPQSDNNKYYWEIQYDRDNHVSYHTLRDVNPTFEWESNGEDLTGNYVARLIAMTQNMGPSGNIVECRDTVENNILLVNDFLQFPTAVTPNGDGINDTFVIKNLIDGLGYPNNSLVIYDRWGKRVYYKENITTIDDFWDPANVPDGTYFWRFTGRGYLGDIQRNGSVEVIH